MAQANHAGGSSHAKVITLPVASDRASDYEKLDTDFIIDVPKIVDISERTAFSSQAQLYSYLLSIGKGTAPSSKKTQNTKMPDVTREEINAKLETIEARMDTRVAEVVGRMDTMIAEMRSDRIRTGQIEQSITALRTEVKASEREMKTQTSSLKTTFIITALASVLSIVGGVAAFNSTVLSNMVASFESGKNTAQSLGETTRRLEDIQKRLEAMQSAQSHQTPPSK